jgi:hypothetical protein
MLKRKCALLVSVIQILKRCVQTFRPRTKMHEFDLAVVFLQTNAKRAMLLVIENIARLGERRVNLLPTRVN